MRYKVKKLIMYFNVMSLFIVLFACNNKLNKKSDLENEKDEMVQTSLEEKETIEEHYYSGDEEIEIYQHLITEENFNEDLLDSIMQEEGSKDFVTTRDDLRWDNWALTDGFVEKFNEEKGCLFYYYPKLYMEAQIDGDLFDYENKRMIFEVAYPVDDDCFQTYRQRYEAKFVITDDLFLEDVVLKEMGTINNLYDLNLMQKINNTKTIADYDSETTVDNMNGVFLGRYFQNNDNDKDFIEWLVIDVDKANRKALLLSKYILDCRCYDLKDYGRDITWEECLLREWLNDEFYNIAFTNEEKKIIEMSEIVNDDNKKCGTFGGNNTEDKVFLLSHDECIKYFDDFKRNEIDFYNKKLATCGTEYAKNIDNFDWNLCIDEEVIDKNETWHKGNSPFWLRTPGYMQNCQASVRENGYIDYYIYDIDPRGFGIRPAIWINY